MTKVKIKTIEDVCRMNEDYWIYENKGIKYCELATSIGHEVGCTYCRESEIMVEIGCYRCLK